MERRSFSYIRTTVGYSTERKKRRGVVALLRVIVRCVRTDEGVEKIW